MNNEKCDRGKTETLKLVGEQINLTSRSDQSLRSGSSSHRSRRPHSAVIPTRAFAEQKTTCPRPKSAEISLLSHSSSRSPLQWPYNLIQSKVDEKASVSHFTDSSSKLLQDLLETPGGNLTHDGDSGKDYENLEVEKKFSQVEEYLQRDYLKYHEKSDSENEKKKESLESLKVQRWLPEVTEEKTVRFTATMERDKHRCHRRDFVHHHCHHKSHIHSCRRNEDDQQHTHTCRRLFQGSESKTGLELRGRVVFAEDSNILNQPEKEKEEKKTESWLEKTLEDSQAGPSDPMQASSDQQNFEYFSKDNNFENLLEDSSEAELEEINKISQQNQSEEEKPKTSFPRMSSDSTYEEMVRLLQTLEEEDSESLNSELNKMDSQVTNPPRVGSPERQPDALRAVYSYLEEMEKEDEDLERRETDTKECSRNFSSPRLEELLNKNSVELAHEVLSLKLQLEDQRKGIKLLRETLAEMKEERKTIDLEHQEALHKASADAEILVQRHQKFIKQLLNEKKNLNETVSKLVEDLKSGEERYKRNIKAMEEKHVIEVKRAKEAQAIADKIKREKWMETKTLKIKEMTVKGLEPELSRMAARQQEEMTELRNLHRAELEAVELRAARRTSELMDELRAQLTKEKESAIARETAALRSSMEKEFEEERNRYQKLYQSLKERLRKEEEKLSNREMEFHQKLLEHKQEEEKERQKIARDHQDKIEELRRRHLVELKNLRESLEAEKEIWANNYKKQQAAKFFEKETELHQQYKRERDRDIEMIIETLEKESAQIQLELNTAAENKLKRLRDKLEADIKEFEASEAALKSKLSEAKSQLLAKEDFITELNSQIRQLQTEITFLRQSCEEMTAERARIKEVIRGEFESSLGDAAKEKENLEKEIIILKEMHIKELSKRDQLNLQAKNEMQKELARVYSRFKTAVSKKEKMIESLREENRTSSQRCQQLELMLDQQRRNLLL